MQFEKIYSMNLLLCLYVTYVQVMEKKAQQHSFGGGQAKDSVSKHERVQEIKKFKQP